MINRKITKVLLLVGPLTLSSYSQINDSNSKSSSTKKRSRPTSVADLDNPEIVPVRKTRDALIENLTLKKVIQVGLSENAFQKAREQTYFQNNLELRNLWAEMWMPTVRATIDSTQGLRRLRNNNGTPNTPRDPQGAFGIELTDFNLFNWGRDYLNYLGAKQSVHRRQEALAEKKRQLRMDLIGTYFLFLNRISNVQFLKQKLKNVSFARRVAKRKYDLKRGKSQDVFHTELEYQAAQNNYLTRSVDKHTSELALAYLLNDDPDTRYKSSEALKYRSLQFPMEDAITNAAANSPSVRQAKSGLIVAQHSYRKTTRDNLPLPTISLDLGAYQYTFSNGGRDYAWAGGSRSDDIELVATLNMSWTLFGRQGWLNRRTNQFSYLNKVKKEIEFHEAKRRIESLMLNIYRQVRLYERQVEINEKRLKSAQISWERSIDNFMAGKTTFAHVKLIIDSLAQAQIDMEKSKYQHLKLKLQVAYLAGIDDLPGESFENLADF